LSAASDTDSRKGPRVYLDYDQAELDAAYDQAAFAPNLAQITGRYVTNSNAARERLGTPERFSYGPSAVEYIEVFRTKRDDAPIFMFLRGGAWKMTQTARYDFAAETFVNAGVHFVPICFTGIDEAGGDLGALATQVRRAVAWVHEHARLFGGNPDRLYIGGHSSGAHLAAVVASTDWSAFGAPPATIKGALCCSGMYDLEPVRLSKRSAYVKLDAGTVEALSALRNLHLIRAPLVVAYGTLESPEFHRQGEAFVQALEANGKPVHAILGEGYNHFELIETLGNPYGLIGRAALDLMEPLRA
jgi:arylformamidase